MLPPRALAPGARPAMAQLDLIQLMAQALMMGDELHSRQTASSALLLRALAPTIASQNTHPQATATLHEQ